MVKNHFENFGNHIVQRLSTEFFLKRLWILYQLVSYAILVNSTLWEEFYLEKLF